MSDGSEHVGEPAADVPTHDPTDSNCMGKKTSREDGDVLFAGYCQAHPGKGTDHVGEGRCKLHGGASTGAPENNGNAAKHNLRADRGKLYHRLSEGRREKVDDLEAALVARYEEFHGREPDRADVEDLFELAMGYVQRDYARDWMVDNPEAADNPTVETVYTDNGPIQVPARIHEMLMDSRREDRLMKKDMGLFRDPQTETAEAVATLADITDDS